MPFLHSRGTGLCKTLRYPCRGTIFTLQLPPIPILSPLHRFLHLLDPPGTTSPSSLQDAPQAAPQMDNAHTVCEPRFPPIGWFCPQRTISRLPLHLPTAE